MDGRPGHMAQPLPCSCHPSSARPSRPRAWPLLLCPGGHFSTMMGAAHHLDGHYTVRRRPPHAHAHVAALASAALDGQPGRLASVGGLHEPHAPRLPPRSMHRKRSPNPSLRARRSSGRWSRGCRWGPGMCGRSCAGVAIRRPASLQGRPSPPPPPVLPPSPPPVPCFPPFPQHMEAINALAKGHRNNELLNSGLAGITDAGLSRNGTLVSSAAFRAVIDSEFSRVAWRRCGADPPCTATAVHSRACVGTSRTACAEHHAPCESPMSRASAAPAPWLTPLTAATAAPPQPHARRRAAAPAAAVRGRVAAHGVPGGTAGGAA
jgi:hypothetical protein